MYVHVTELHAMSTGEALFTVCLISNIIKQNHVLDIGGYLHPLPIGMTVPLFVGKKLGSSVIFSTKFTFLLFVHVFSKNNIKEDHSKQSKVDDLNLHYM